MPEFNVQWTLVGECVVEADDIDEAEQLVKDGVMNLDHSQFESIDCDECTIEMAKEVK